MRFLKTLTSRNIRFILAMALATIAFALFSPSNETNACLPCVCPGPNPTINCYGPMAVYTVTRDNGTCAIVIFAVDENGNGTRVISQSAQRLSLVPDRPPFNVLLAKNDIHKIYLYKLTSGEYQVNAGPDREAKVFQIRWRGCPAEIQGRHETTWIATAP